jgi:hypothetical protein
LGFKCIRHGVVSSTKRLILAKSAVSSLNFTLLLIIVFGRKSGVNSTAVDLGDNRNSFKKKIQIGSQEIVFIPGFSIRVLWCLPAWSSVAQLYEILEEFIMTVMTTQ